MGEPEPSEGRKVFTLFRVSLLLCAGAATWGIVSPASLSHAAEVLTSTAFRALDWFFMTSVTGFLIVSLYLALGRHGTIKLGADDDEPEFSTGSWLSMLFAAGMGVGLLFWGVAEPMTHFSSPPIGEGGTPQAARLALVITNFHWGLHAWACYGVGALVLAYFGFKRGAPYLAGTPIRSAYEGRWVAPVASLADLVAVVAVAFGVAGSVAMGVFQLRTGLHVVFGAPQSGTWISWVILAVLVVCYLTSAATSLDKGIKWLSNINMLLAVSLLAFVVLAGPTAFLLRSVVTSLSDYASHLVGLSLRLYPYRDVGGWVHSWTLTYLIWWIAWAPFVGIFIARISRGRTIRQFILGVLFAPTLFSVLWFGVFGGMGYYEEMHGAGGMAELVRENVTVALFTLYERLPLTPVLSGITVLLLFVFLVTSVDSATFVLAMLTSHGSHNPPRRRKIGWGLGLGALGAAVMLSDSVDAARAAAVSGAIPFVFILLLQVGGLLRALAADAPAKPAPPPRAEPAAEANQ